MTDRGRRAFVGLFPPPQIAGRITEHLSDTAPQIRWMPAANLHVTMLFQRTAPDLARWADRLYDALADLEPLRLRLAGVETVPGRRETVVWLSVAPVEEADAAALRELRIATGAPAGHRPHVTVARVPEQYLPSAVWAVESMPPVEWTVTEVGLYTSTLGAGPQGRSRYDAVATYPLRRPAPPGPVQRPRLR